MAKVLLTVVPSAPRTSIGNNIRSGVLSANPREIAIEARNRPASDRCHSVFFEMRHGDSATDRARSAGVLSDAFFRCTTLLAGAALRGIGAASPGILPSVL